MQDSDIRALADRAISAREKSYSPYSGFRVGAALLCRDGKIYTGANIENAAYTPTVCAERVAFFKAVNDGERDFVAVAVAGGAESGAPKDFFPPCGVCRQVMAEFCNEDFKIIMAAEGKTQVYTLGELLPANFGKEFMDGKNENV